MFICGGVYQDQFLGCCLLNINPASAAAHPDRLKVKSSDEELCFHFCRILTDNLNLDSSLIMNPSELPLLSR